MDSRDLHEFEYDSEMSAECARCGREHLGWVSAHQPAEPASSRGQRRNVDYHGCGVLLAGLGLFIAGVGFGSLYLVATLREVF